MGNAVAVAGRTPCEREKKCSRLCLGPCSCGVVKVDNSYRWAHGLASNATTAAKHPDFTQDQIFDDFKKPLNLLPCCTCNRL